MVQTKLFSEGLTREELNSLVDRAADLIRTAVDYKFILVLLFLKRINDVWKVERRRIVERLVREVGLSGRRLKLRPIGRIITRSTFLGSVSGMRLRGTLGGCLRGLPRL